MKAPFAIATARLMLTRPLAADAQEIFERYAGDADVTRFLGWPRHRSRADTDAFLQFSDAQWAEWPAGPYLIRLADSGRLVGSTGFAYDTPHEAATGYVLAKDAWGRGYATEALRAIVNVAPGIGVARLYALCHPAHEASQRVLEKCGFVREASWTRQVAFPNLAPGVQQDVVCYVLESSKFKS